MDKVVPSTVTSVVAETLSSPEVMAISASPRATNP